MVVTSNLLFFWACALNIATAVAQQPIVTTLERLPSRKAAGIVSLPNGSPWCRGKPTIWLPGHKDFVVDEPNCLVDGKWTRPSYAKMDIIDKYNGIDGSKVIDRHDCGVLHANKDGMMDIYCLVGANRGTGSGFNELYLTTKTGTLHKIKKHGLQRFKGARTRKTTMLRSVNGTSLVFVSASYGPREDGRKNTHAMFRTNQKYTEDPGTRYFEHVPGAWQTHTNSSNVLSFDINGDGLDDLIVCNDKEGAFIYMQTENGKFRKSIPIRDGSQTNWRSAAVADFTGDGVPDLAVVYQSEANSFLRVFKGRPVWPYFIFKRRPYYSRPLQYAAPDIEAFDANGDGAMDLYIVQTNETRKNRDGSAILNNYCGGSLDTTRWWKNPELQKTPPNNFVPPRDMAADLLLLGNRKRNAPEPNRFRVVRMNHREPGCGAMVKKFGERALVLAQGGFVRPGHQLLLQW